MGKNNKICPNCGRKMKQQFIGLQHCKCGISWKRDTGFFRRTNDMVFALQKTNVSDKEKTAPCHTFPKESIRKRYSRFTPL